jgi:hypothetical protein
MKYLGCCHFIFLSYLDLLSSKEFQFQLNKFVAIVFLAHEKLCKKVSETDREAMLVLCATWGMFGTMVQLEIAVGEEMKGEDGRLMQISWILNGREVQGFQGF